MDVTEYYSRDQLALYYTGFTIAQAACGNLDNALLSTIYFFEEVREVQ